jgi:hypothetical protein
VKHRDDYPTPPRAARTDLLPVLDLYKRYTGSTTSEMYLTGAFGGMKIFIYPIAGAHPDDRCWRVYVAPRQQGIERDRSMPTRVTPTNRPGTREPQTVTKQLAAIGMQAPFYPEEVQSEFLDTDEL